MASRGLSTGSWCAIGLLAASALAAMTAPVRAQSPQLIVDLLTTPQKYWNTTVILKGHVRAVTPNPPGTNRGSYVFRDSSDSDITIRTSELPAIGKEYTVTGTVVQETPEATVPVLHEVSRRLGVTAGAAAPSASEPAAAAAPRTPPAAPRERAPSAATPPATVPVAPPAATPVASAPGPDTTSGFSTPLLMALVVVVALLSIVLIVAFWPRRAVVSSPPAVVRIEPPVLEAQRVMLPSAGLPRPGASSAADVPTRFVPPPTPPPAATTLFVDLGADLVVTEGPDRGKKFPLTKPRIAIGRTGARQNDVTLSDESVSREHAKILYNPGDQTFRLINESTLNPTRVNGNAAESVLLQDNDLIQLGGTSLKFVRKPKNASA